RPTTSGCTGAEEGEVPPVICLRFETDPTLERLAFVAALVRYFVSHMVSASTGQVLAATRQWLKPLVHVLIRCGITWRDFAEVARTAYVEVATGQFGKR